MKRVTRNWLGLLMAVMMVVLTACGADATATPAPAAPTNTTAPVAAPPTNTTAPVAAPPTNTAAAMAPTAMPAAPTAMPGGTVPKVTGPLTVWESYGSSHGSAESDAWTAALAKFKTDNPDATVTALDVPFDQIFTKFETEAGSGGGPDLFIAPNDSLGKEARANLFLPLDAMLAGKLGNDSDVSVNGSKVGGKLYEVPESLKAVALFYDKSKLPTPPKTTDELLTAVKGGLKIGLQESAYHNWGFYNAFGGTVFDANGVASASQGMIDAFQYLADLKAAGAQFYSDGGKLSADFESGAVAATIDGPWLTGDYKKALADKLAVAPIPAGPKGPAMPMTGVDGWYLNANTKVAQQALNFALYMTSPAIEQIWIDTAGHIPADKTLKVSDPVNQGFATAVATGFPRPQTAELDNYWGPFGDALTKLLESGLDAKTAVTNAVTATNTANKKSGGTGTTAATATTGSSGPAMTVPKVTGALTVWESYGSSHGSAESDAWTAALAKFKTDNPDATVTALDVPFDQIFTKFETEAGSGGGPDLFIAPNDSLGKEARANLFLPLDAMLAGKLGNDSDVSVNGSKVGGKLYEVPESLKAVALFYDKSKLPTPPKTTDELLTAVKGGLKIGLQESAYHNWGFYNAFGGTVFDSTGKATASQGMIDAFQYLADLKAAGAQFYSDGGKLSADFESGAVAATIDGPWLTGDYKKALGDKLAVAPIPAGPKGPAMPMTGVDGWYLNANTKVAQQALNFALYMTSPAIEQIWIDTAGHIPADKTLKVSDPVNQGFATAVASGFPRPQTAELDNYWGPFGDALTKLLESGLDAKTAVTNAVTATNTANKK